MTPTALDIDAPPDPDPWAMLPEVPQPRLPSKRALRGLDHSRIVPYGFDSYGEERFAYVDANGLKIPLPSGRELPSSDGVPLESAWHIVAIQLLIDSINHYWRDRRDYYVGGDMFVHYSAEEVFNKDFRGPDVFLVTGVEKYEKYRPNWVTWQEGHRFPDLIVEMVSPSSYENDLFVKKELYCNIFKTTEYFCVEHQNDKRDEIPSPGPIHAWRMAKGKYVPIEPIDGRYHSKILGASLGWGTGRLDQPGFPSMSFPRLFDANGTVVMTVREAEKLDAEKARKIAKRDRLKAKLEKQMAEQEKLRADAAEWELAQLRAELERIRTGHS